jgi:mono/diheme cytochrome c family protein
VAFIACLLGFGILCPVAIWAAEPAAGAAFFESKIRPILVAHCYECHSEKAQTAEGGLLLDRQTGWLQGGEQGKAVLPGEPEQSLLISAVRRSDKLKMPPDQAISPDQIRLLEDWVRRGAPGPLADMGDTDFSRLGDQTYIFEKAAQHWAFHPVRSVIAPVSDRSQWNQSMVDRFVVARLKDAQIEPSLAASPFELYRRLCYDLTGLPPSMDARDRFCGIASTQPDEAVATLVDELLASDAFGEHVGRMWLDVARYADTDSFYRPDTKTAHYFPFAFTYRDYVIRAFNDDKPYDQFIIEQLAADLLDFPASAPALAGLGFLTVGPHANRNPTESIDDWIDVTTRGLMGMTAACARCHDHKYEPIPTADYYALHGVFASVIRVNPLDESKQPKLDGYQPTEAELADYALKRGAIDEKINGAGKSKSKNNNQSVAQKIRETELAELLLFHPGAPTHTMVVRDRPKPVSPTIFLRGDPTARGETVDRRFLTALDPTNEPFPKNSSGRLELARKITDPSNPLTARVFVNRIWGMLVGYHLVSTPSDFGLQGAQPSHPELLDWLTADFVEHGWSTKHLVRRIVLSRTYQQSSQHRDDAADVDPTNILLWRAHRKHLSIESIRDSLLSVSGELEHRLYGRPQQLWGDGYTRRRTIYGYINRFNLDPTLRAFDFPTPMQTQAQRDESIVAPQALFTMNSSFVVDRVHAIVTKDTFMSLKANDQRTAHLFQLIYQRDPVPAEVKRVGQFIEQQKRFVKGKRTISPWASLAQALLMSNEFQYVD